MAQNIYDRSDFFDAYSRLRRSSEGLDGAAEWPALRALLPDLRGLEIVDMGCGYGWFCRWAQEQGAAHVLGVDVSEKMLQRAKSAGSEPAIVYERADLERLTLPKAQFDLAFSSLAIHYVEDIARLFAEVRRALRPGGRFVFSTEHPIFTAPSRQGWSTAPDGRRLWPIDSYFVEGARITDWLAPGVVKQHRTLGAVFGRLIEAGFVVDHLEEFCPTRDQIAANPDMAEEIDRPMFLLIRARLSTEPNDPR
jgi:SAM-dependent methyltransferase